MKKQLFVGSLFVLMLQSFNLVQAQAVSGPTPIVAPTKRHNSEFEIKKHMAWQYRRISDARKAGSITPAQEQALNGLVTLSYKKTKADYWDNKKNWLTPDQEADVFRLLTNSGRAIDKAVGKLSADRS